MLTLLFALSKSSKSNTCTSDLDKIHWDHFCNWLTWKILHVLTDNLYLKVCCYREDVPWSYRKISSSGGWMIWVWSHAVPSSISLSWTCARVRRMATWTPRRRPWSRPRRRILVAPSLASGDRGCGTPSSIPGHQNWLRWVKMCYVFLIVKLFFYTTHSLIRTSGQHVTYQRHINKI